MNQRDIDRIAARSPELAVYYCVCGGTETKNHTQTCRDNMSRLNDMQRALYDAHQQLAAPTDISGERALLEEVYEYFMGPNACGDFTCSCGKPKVCGICDMRRRVKKFLAAPQQTTAAKQEEK